MTEQLRFPDQQPHPREPLTITIPLTPALVLNPNRNRAGFQSRHTLKRAERDLSTATRAAIANLRAAYPGRLPTPYFTTPVHCQLTIYRKKGAQIWDDDNLHAALKRGTYDILQSEGLVANDRLLRHLPPKWDRDREGLGYIVLELTAESSGIPRTS